MDFSNILPIENNKVIAIKKERNQDIHFKIQEVASKVVKPTIINCSLPSSAKVNNKKNSILMKF